MTSNDREVKPFIETITPEAAAAVLAIVDAPYKPGLDARFESDECPCADGVASEKCSPRGCAPRADAGRQAPEETP